MRDARAPRVLAGLVGLWIGMLPVALTAALAAAPAGAAGPLGPREAPGSAPSGNSRPATGSKPATSSHTAVATPGPTHVPKIPADALERMPDDATGYCGDGTWTASATKQGACSGHGGVSVWLGTPPHGATGRCKDGSYTRAKEASGGACSSHGGLKFWGHPAKPPNTKAG
ncbi:MAG TPA: DUF3761 domain-containing protein [Patescibacteria group bacterium]|nr:DUF3761 domain-containing protein [Patescibacteria group bacterium]